MKYMRKTLAIVIGVFAIGIFVIYFPYRIGIASPPILGGGENFFRYAAIVPILGGLFISGKCMWDFIFKGQGTPVPIDAPQRLIVTGFYRWVRNPMYLGLLVVLLGYFLWFQTVGLLFYIGAGFLAIHLLVVYYEEPILEQHFGEAYQRYCQAVPRWVPRISQRQEHNR